MTRLPLTVHARHRCQQRGVPFHIVQLILDHHDVDHHAGGPCRVLRVSKRALDGEGLEGIPRQDVDRLYNLAVVYNEATDRLVTVLHDFGGPIGRRYRRAAR